MRNISQMTFLNTMKMFELRLRIHWSFFLRVQIATFLHWFKKWLGALQPTSHYMNNDGLVYWSVYASLGLNEFTHWDRVTHICVSRLSIFGSDNGLSPGRWQVQIWTSAGILLIGQLGPYFIEILVEISTFSFQKIYIWKFRLGNVGHFVSASLCVNRLMFRTSLHQWAFGSFPSLTHWDRDEIGAIL